VKGPSRVSADELRLYSTLAGWFHLLTAPEDYAEEAAVYLRVLSDALGAVPETLLELGSGGGNNASHLKRHVACTLVDFSPAMLEISRRLNPECEHIEGDMRSVRLGRVFDAVFVHDAIAYMTTEYDLRAALETAFVHTRPGGALLVVPDCTTENFAARTGSGGHDGAERCMRYLEWITDPDPDDTTYDTDYAYLLRERDGSVRVEHERHTCGLFPQATWLRLLHEAGFEASALALRLEGPPTWEGVIFSGRRSSRA
jgi:SAM-dependent methyltransferase